MSGYSINRQRARELDHKAVEEFGLPSIVLMENAGRGVADKLCQLGIDGRVVICCGPGNNGGDGFVIARQLDLRGYQVHVFAWGWNRDSNADVCKATSATDAAVNLQVLRAAKIPLRFDPESSVLSAELRQAAWVIDALLGTGARGEPRPPLDLVIDTINASGVPVLAVDLPSGLDCDTGEAAKHAIHARHTCTFVAAKPGFFVIGAKAYTGEIHICDIGAPRVLVEQMLLPNDPIQVR